MKHFTKEQLRQARKTDLYEFLLNNHHDLFKKEGNSIHPVDNRSLSIKEGYCGYLDFATDEKGNSVDFLTRHLGYQLDEAVFALCSESSRDSKISSRERLLKTEKIPPQFPKSVNAPYRQLYAYLMSRGISAETIKMLIDFGVLYQDKNNNIIFINKERTWGEKRGTNTFADTRCIYRSECKDFNEGSHGWCTCMSNCEKYKKDSFRGMIAGSKKDGFWWFKTGEGRFDKVYVCESSIDAISLYELNRFAGIKENAGYVSIGGTAKQPAIDRIKKHTRVILAVDNDKAGAECRSRNADLESIIPKLKDWNEDLMANKQSLNLA